MRKVQVESHVMIKVVSWFGQIDLEKVKPWHVGLVLDQAKKLQESLTGGGA